MGKESVVLGLSGGMDSVTLAGYYLNKGFSVFPVIFSYGSKHNEYENKAAIRVCKFYNLSSPACIDLSFVGTLFSSNLLKSGGEIPDGHYQADNMKLAVVPGRNLIFISIMMGYAWSVGVRIVALGVHSGDRVIYPDCRKEFVNIMDEAVKLGSDGLVRLEAPFQDLNKFDILRMGFSFFPTVPYHLTRTCYKNQELSCGNCGSCQERLEAFRNIGKDDPIQYEK